MKLTPVPGIVLDADTLSDVVKERPEVEARFWRSVGDGRAIPVAAPALYEVAEGLTRANPTNVILARRVRLRSIRTVLEVLPSDEAAADRAAEVAAALNKTGRGIGKVDPQIAGIALATDRTLVTSNARHFRQAQAVAPALRLESWRA